jgi:hypothetical protein
MWGDMCGERCGDAAACANCPLYELAEPGGEWSGPLRRGGERERESRPGEPPCEEDECEEEREREGGTGEKPAVGMEGLLKDVGGAEPFE